MNETNGPEGVAQVERFLRDRFGAGIADVAPLGQGEWSRAYAFRLRGDHFVVRFGAYYEDFAKDRLAATLASPALPIPRMVDLGDAFDGFFAVAERVFGAYLDDLDEQGMRRVLPSLFGSLDGARLADVSASTGFGLWTADGTAPSLSWRSWLLDVADDPPTARTHGWRHRLAQAPAGEAAFEEAFAAMAALVPHCPEVRHLIHADLVHENVLVDGGRITGVLDWGCALYGDFLYDLAWLCFWSPWYPAWRGIDFALEALRHFAVIGLAVPHFAERLRCYALHVGLAGQAYNAFKERWDELGAVAQRTLTLARTPLRYTAQPNPLPAPYPVLCDPETER